MLCCVVLCCVVLCCVVLCCVVLCLCRAVKKERLASSKNKCLCVCCFVFLFFGFVNRDNYFFWVSISLYRAYERKEREGMLYIHTKGICGEGIPRTVSISGPPPYLL